MTTANSFPAPVFGSRDITFAFAGYNSWIMAQSARRKHDKSLGDLPEKMGKQINNEPKIDQMTRHPL